MKENSPASESQKQKGIVMALSLNWRGVISEESQKFWRRFRVSRRTSIKNMHETYKIW